MGLDSTSTHYNTFTETFEIQTPLYSGHTAVVQMVSVLYPTVYSLTQSLNLYLYPHFLHNSHPYICVITHLSCTHTCLLSTPHTHLPLLTPFLLSPVPTLPPPSLLPLLSFSTSSLPHFFSGKRRYLILREGCLYYFANETASHPKGSFVLVGYT